MSNFDDMIARHARKLEEDVETAIAKATPRADEVGCGLRVERYINQTVVVITDTVPQGMVERTRYNEYYDPEEPRL